MRISLSPAVIQSALEKLTTGQSFANAERMRRFISFVVKQTLQGKGETLKEYTVGVEVFDRGPDFDPQTDTIVRVEARRLRKKLEEYYSGEGNSENVIIKLPSGSYVPIFEARSDRGSRDLLAPPSTTIGSVGVLPFVDLSPIKGQEYFCDGISEELINALSADRSLKVAARTSAFRFRGNTNDVKRIGAELGVEHIVTGAVRISGTRVRVTARLIQTWDGYHVWVHQLDRDLTEIFSIQEELARAVASSVASDIGAWINLPQTTNLEAYHYYLEARHHWRRFTLPATIAAAEYFERAIGADPSFATAYAGLADCYMQLSLFGAAPPAELAEKTRKAAERALALDPGCAEAYAQLGAISALYDWDWEESERCLRHAIELQPNYVNSHWLFANFCLAPQKRLDEALSEARRAVVVDPLSSLVHAMAGAVFWHRHEWDAALVELDEALHLEPSFVFALNIRSFVYISQGRLDLAAGTTGRAWCRGYVQARLGNTPAARADLLQLVAKPTDPVAIAATYAGLGEEENALTWLEKCADAKVPQMVWLLDHAVFESLQGAPRYRAIRTRMHLP